MFSYQLLAAHGVYMQFLFGFPILTTIAGDPRGSQATGKQQEWDMKN